MAATRTAVRRTPATRAAEAAARLAFLQSLFADERAARKAASAVMAIPVKAPR